MRVPRITYALEDGSEYTVDVPVGRTVMEGSVLNNLPGILAECGGNCSCATCHVHVASEWATAFGGPSAEETELLEFAEHVRAESRLACQLVVSQDCDGAYVRVP